jgi:hypothetical protein
MKPINKLITEIVLIHNAGQGTSASFNACVLQHV